MKAHWPISILSTLSSLVSMALPLILVRTLDPSLLGSFKIFFLYLMVLPPLTFIAGVSSGLSYWAGRGEEGRKAIRNSGILFLVISTFALVLMLACKMILARELNVGADWISLFAYALFFGIASMFYDDAAIATGRIWTGAIFNSGFELMRTGVIVITAVMTHDLFSIIKAHILVQMLKMVSGYALAYHQDLFRLEWNPEVFKSVARYAFPVSLAFVFGLWLNYSDQIILSKTIATAEFAIYTVCCLTVPPLFVLEASVTRVLIPQLSQAFAANQSKEAASLYKTAVNELGFLVIPAVFGMFIFAAPIIELLFTKSYLPGTHYLRLYSLWYLALLLPPDSVARAQGQAKWILKNFIFFSVLTLTLCFGFAHSFGAMGVMTGLLIARFSSRFYTVYYLNRHLSWGLSDFIPFASLTKMTFVCTLLGAACFLLRPFFQSPLLWFFVCGMGFTMSYLAITFSLLKKARVQNQKVLMLTPSLFIGGLERMILNLSKSLKETSGWQPQVWAYDFADSTGANLITSFQSLEIPVHSKIKPPRFSFKTASQIAKQAFQEGVTVIHTHDLGALIYGSIAKLFLLGRVRLVHTQHSFVHLNRSWKYRHYERFFTLFADSIAVVSPDTQKSYLKLGVSEKKLHVIPNGVDFPTGPDLDRPARTLKRAELVASLKVAPQLLPWVNDFWILYLARIHGKKGQDLAIKLWNELDPEIRKKSVLLFVGPEAESGELARLESQIKEAVDSSRLVVTGPSENPNDWIRVSDLFLSSSEFEGMPLAPMEALGSGIPAVLSQIAGHEFLSEFATLYPLAEPKLGARAVEKIFNDCMIDETNLRKREWNRSSAIRDSFTLSTMSKKYEKLYE